MAAVHSSENATESPHADDGLALLACYGCKRRKVRCNRLLPICSLCEKTGSECEYPTHAEKPGPKAGTPQRNKRRRIGDRNDENSDDAWKSGHEYASSTNRRTTLSSSGEDEARFALSDRDSPTSETTVHPTVASIAQLMFPSHEAQPRQRPPLSPEPSPDQLSKPLAVTIKRVCSALKISPDTYTALMASYFANMTSFSLFRPGSIEGRLTSMQSLAEAEALVAAMFSFAARFFSCPDYTGRAGDCPEPAYFADIASARLEKVLDDCEDTKPPLWALQTYVLNSFYQLTRSVRSRSWTYLGGCIRLAYDLRLHLVDADFDPDADTSKIDIRRWSHQEERRRAWWAVWEMDVYASTIRRLPTAINWNETMTLLPVHDNCWFNDIYQRSCLFDSDCNVRWRCLEASGNNSPRAWFLVINALMRNVQSLVYPTKAPADSQRETLQADLSITANTIYCTNLSLPTELAYGGEMLDFRTKFSPRDVSSRQHHCDIYSLHVMIQLNRFLISHHKIIAHGKTTNRGSPQHACESVTSLSASEWSTYINAADEIIGLIRGSSKDHYKYINPFIINSIWFAAAAQIAIKVFGPQKFDPRLAESNLQLLRLTVDRFTIFWGSTDTLKSKLGQMEAGMTKLMLARDQPGSGSSVSPRGQTHQTHYSTTDPELSAAAAGTSGSSTVATTLGYTTPGSTGSAVADAQMYGYSDAMLDPVAAGLMPNLFDLPGFGLADPGSFLGSGAGSARSGSMDYFPYGLDEMLLLGAAGLGAGSGLHQQHQSQPPPPH